MPRSPRKGDRSTADPVQGAHRKRELGKAGSTWARSIEASKKKEKLVKLIAGGSTVAQATAELGMTRSGYDYYRNTDSIFRAQVDALRVEKLSDLVAPYQGDFISFRKQFFEMDSYWHQREIIRAIEHAKPGEIVLVNVPPEHGKTTVLEDYCNFKLATDPDHRITVVSEGQGHARKMLGRVARRMTDERVGRAYIERFGPFRMPHHPRPWSADYFTVWGATHDERDYSMEARGWRSSIAGTRSDLFLVDDIQSLRSLNLTEAMIARFRQDMLTRPGREGKVVIVKTRVGPGDFSEALVELELVKPKNHICLPAMRDGEALCPEMWPVEALENRRHQVGEDVWWRNYQQAPRAAENATFTDEMIERSWDLTRKLGDQPEWMAAKVAALDPALSGGNAICVAGYDGSRFGIIDIDHARNLARVEAILERVEHMAARHGFDDLVVEGNAYQKGLGEDARLKELGARYGFRIHTHFTSGSKVDQAIGVARIPNGFIKGEISLPGADQDSRGKLEILVNQLRNWRADIPTRRLTQDQVMALWMAWLFWERKRAMIGASSTWKRQGVPWRQTTSAPGWNRHKKVMGVTQTRRSA